MRERGSVTLWLLGLAIAVLLLGGLSVDVWRALSERRALVALADSAATAGASGIDEDQWRIDGSIVLDEARAEQIALDLIARHDLASQLAGPPVINADLDRIEVILTRHIGLTLLRVLPAERDTIRVQALGVASPARAP